MSKELKKGDVVEVRFPNGETTWGIIKDKIGPMVWDILVQGEGQDVRRFEGEINSLEPALNIFAFIREKLCVML